MKIKQVKKRTLIKNNIIKGEIDADNKSIDKPGKKKQEDKI